MYITCVYLCVCGVCVCVVCAMCVCAMCGCAMVCVCDVCHIVYGVSLYYHDNIIMVFACYSNKLLLVYFNLGQTPNTRRKQIHIHVYIYIHDVVCTT